MLTPAVRQTRSCDLKALPRSARRLAGPADRVVTRYGPSPIQSAAIRSMSRPALQSVSLRWNIRRPFGAAASFVMPHGISLHLDCPEHITAFVSRADFIDAATGTVVPKKVSQTQSRCSSARAEGIAPHQCLDFPAFPRQFLQGALVGCASLEPCFQQPRNNDEAETEIQSQLD